MKFYACKNTHKKTLDKIPCQVFLNKLPKVTCPSTNLLIYLHFEPERIGNIVIAVGSPSGSNHDRTIPENTSQNTLYHLNPLALCQDKFNRPSNAAPACWF
jgi:hypothetical protein